MHVRKETLTHWGAVSEDVVMEMAEGASKALGVDCSIAVSGIAGPEGGTEDKPVGTVWICTKYRAKLLTRKYTLGKFRDANIMRASNVAMLQMLSMLDNE